jgi:spoIIIJ-associated protein
MNLSPKELLDTLLGYLGFVCEISEIEDETGPVLMIYTGEAERLIGLHGERLQDIQYLLNRILLEKSPETARVTVDCEHYRAMREDELVARIRERAERVRRTGKPITLDPMNSYDRRTVHNAFKDDPEIETSSPAGDRRMKCITLRRRSATGAKRQEHQD